MPIVYRINRSENLTTFTVTGAITLEDIMQELEFFYKGEPTKNALWDFTNASLWNYTEKDIHVISSFSPRHEKGGSRNKTAIVAKDGFSIDFVKPDQKINPALINDFVYYPFLHLKRKYICQYCKYDRKGESPLQRFSELIYFQSVFFIAEEANSRIRRAPVLHGRSQILVVRNAVKCFRLLR